MNNLKQAVPFFHVTNMQRSVSFYRDGIGMRIVHRWEPEGVLKWCSLERGPVAIMLQELHPSKLPLEQAGNGLTISFQCEDAIALYHEFMSHGLQPERPFVGNSMWVFSLQDPDGFRLEFESPTDAEEGSVFEG